MENGILPPRKCVEAGYLSRNSQPGVGTGEVETARPPVRHLRRLDPGRDLVLVNLQSLRRAQPSLPRGGLAGGAGGGGLAPDEVVQRQL